MSKINIFSLGGLNENGKNMYVVEVDKDIFVFDAGLKYADENMLGIDYIIPNFDYLKENEKRIKGLFLTHGHDENVGAVSDIVRTLHNIKIYGSKFTVDIVRKELEEDRVSFDNLIEIKPHKTISIGKYNIFPINLTHSIPENLGYALYTDDGVVFYASDFVFDSTMRGLYQTDIGKLAYLGKQGVLCLLTESMYASVVGHTAPRHRISDLINKTLAKTDKRIIYNVLSSQLYRIQELFDEVSKTNRKVVIIGKKLQNIINQAIISKSLKVSKSLIGNLSNIDDENSVIVVSNERQKPYSNLMKIVRGVDKFITLKDTDTVFIAIPIFEGREKTFYELANEISAVGVNMVMMNPKVNLSHHASSEDLMQMIDLLQPKYYFPVKGEYRYQVANGELAEKVGVASSNILLKQNGEVVSIVDGNLKPSTYKVNHGDILIDGRLSHDVGEIVLKDRELLSDNGIVVIATTVSKKTKKIVSGPEVLTRGFVYVRDNIDMIKEIKNIVSNVIIKNTNSNYIEYNKVKNSIREELSNYLYDKTGSKPMIISVIQEV
ncbi:MAG: ribonuclease J [bacterium]|nr:ribonuclease J [bacterium]